ncbi:MAG: general stress protein CsbD [Flavobacteriaceae bacterium]
MNSDHLCEKWNQHKVCFKEENPIILDDDVKLAQKMFDDLIERIQEKVKNQIAIKK